MFGRKRRKQIGVTSYAQSGEDLIAAFLLKNILKIEAPFYLDIGAHTPIERNNTYLFYQRGLSGVLVEPNPMYCAVLREARPRDKVVQAGVSDQGGSATYYRLDADTLNTFSAEAAQSYVHHGHKVISEEQVQILSTPELLDSHCERTPDLVSLDVEGLELPILKAWDFHLHRPAVFCIETAEYTPDGSGKKRGDIIAAMGAHGYRIYSDTYVNTIFADGQRWKGQGLIDTFKATAS